MGVRFSHPLFLRSLKAFKIKAFRLFCFARKGQGTTQGTNFGTLSGTLLFSGKTKEPECLDFKGFQAPKEQGMRESNSH